MLTRVFTADRRRDPGLPVSIRVAARRFGIPTNAIRALVDDGSVFVVRIGGVELVRPADVDRTLRRMAAGGTSGSRAGRRIEARQ